MTGGPTLHGEAAFLGGVADVADDDGRYHTTALGLASCVIDEGIVCLAGIPLFPSIYSRF
jgi:hypothetical protein